MIRYIQSTRRQCCDGRSSERRPVFTLVKRALVAPRLSQTAGSGWREATNLESLAEDEDFECVGDVGT